MTRVQELAAALVRNYYSMKDENGDGGNLHIALADGNLDDDSLKFCEEVARQAGDPDGETLAIILRELLTEDERRELYATRWLRKHHL